MAKKKDGRNNIFIILLIVIAFSLFYQTPSTPPPAQSIVGKVGGYGMIGTGIGPVPMQAIGSGNVLFGEYHSGNFDGSSPATVNSQTTFDLKNYMPIGDPYNSNDHAESSNTCCESWSEARTEVALAVVNLGTIYDGGSITFNWFHPDGSKMFGITQPIPDPSPNYYMWVSAYSWIGHFPHEINTPGTYRVDISTSFAGFVESDDSVPDELPEYLV